MSPQVSKLYVLQNGNAHDERKIIVAALSTVGERPNRALRSGKLDVLATRSIAWHITSFRGKTSKEMNVSNRRIEPVNH